VLLLVLLWTLLSRTQDSLRDKSARVGNHLMNCLRQLMDKHPIIGDIRGLGLFVGIDLVRDRESRKQATAEAQHVISRLKEEQILLSADGPYSNVLKIKPPLVFNQDNADRLVTVLDEVLTELRDSKMYGDEDEKVERSGSVSPSEAMKIYEIDPMIDQPNGKRKKLIEDIEAVKL